MLSRPESGARPLVDLTGSAMLVTGGSTGIGAAIVSTAQELGARVGVLDMKPPSDPSVVYAEADVGSGEAVAAAVERLVRELGTIDTLVNNAGIAPSGKFEDITESQWRHTQAVNVDGSFHSTRAALPYIMSSDAGAVVNMASIAGRSHSRTANVAYATSKGAVIAMTRQLAFELAGRGVRVNCVCPGLVDTAIMSRNVSPERLDELVAGIPLGRLAAPREVAALVCFLGSQAASYLTGAVVDVTGGLA
jgi:NAD(P)-dependent dehydrogenase (short-subunit alcohol dehydrogenase family)